MPQPWEGLFFSFFFFFLRGAGGARQSKVEWSMNLTPPDPYGDIMIPLMICSKYCKFTKDVVGKWALSM